MVSFQPNVKVMLRPTGQSASLYWYQAPPGAQDQIFVAVRQLRVSWCGAPSLMKWRVCRLQLLLSLARAVNLGSESRGTRDHILYCLRFEAPPTWRARSPYLHPPTTVWSSYTPRHWLPFALLRWRYSNLPPHGRSKTIRVKQDLKI
jgi:hypothetical protein